MRESILKAMEAQGVTQTALAKMTRIQRTQLSRWLGESNRRGASEETIDKCFKALKIKMTWPETSPKKQPAR